MELQRMGKQVSSLISEMNNMKKPKRENYATHKEYIRAKQKRAEHINKKRKAKNEVNKNVR